MAVVVISFVIANLTKNIEYNAPGAFACSFNSVNNFSKQVQKGENGDFLSPSSLGPSNIIFENAVIFFSSSVLIRLGSSVSSCRKWPY